MVDNVTSLLSWLTLLSSVALAVAVATFCYWYITDKKAISKKPLLTFFASKGLFLAFIVSLTAMLGSLFYSDAAHYTPCKLCWYQRIFMYPQVFLLGIALYREEKHIAIYAAALSFIGGIIALYHYFLQISVVPDIMPCDQLGYSASCSESFVTNLGYITIPMMAFTAFCLLLALELVVWKYNKST